MTQDAGAAPLRAVEEPPADSDALSVLGQLKERREEIKKSSTIHLPVPRWEDPKIVVQYRPVDHKVFRRVNRVIELAPEGKKSEVEVQQNSDVLAEAVVGVYAVIGGKKYSLREGDPTGEPTKFDEDLANNLGCNNSARAVVKALYIFDGDIISTAGKIAEFSGYKEQEADEEVLGE